MTNIQIINQRILPHLDDEEAKMMRQRTSHACSCVESYVKTGEADLLRQAVLHMTGEYDDAETNPEPEKIKK